MKNQIDSTKSYYGGAADYYLRHSFLKKMSKRDPL
jgi:hypothetical protein